MHLNIPSLTRSDPRARPGNTATGASGEWLVGLRARRLHVRGESVLQRLHGTIHYPGQLITSSLGYRSSQSAGTSWRGRAGGWRVPRGVTRPIPPLSRPRSAYQLSVLEEMEAMAPHFLLRGKEIVAHLLPKGRVSHTT